MTKIYNKGNLKKVRKILRNNQTELEKLFWSKVKNKQFFGLKFRRQYSIDRYIVDFYSTDLRLAIEIDGGSHYTEAGKEYDSIRTDYIRALGIRLERFSNQEVMKNIEGVLTYLEEKYIKNCKK